MDRFLKLLTTNQANAVTQTQTLPRTKLYSTSIKYPATILKMSTALNVTVLLSCCFLMEIEVERNFSDFIQIRLTFRITFM